MQLKPTGISYPFNGSLDSCSPGKFSRIVPKRSFRFLPALVLPDPIDLGHGAVQVRILISSNAIHPCLADER